MEFSKRMKQLSTSVFNVLDEEKRKLKQQGSEIYDFTIGSPNIAPSKAIQEALINAAKDESVYMYSLHDTDEFRQTIKEWYQSRYEVNLDPDNEILSLQGSQEGLAHIALAICDEGDIVMIPSPCYPIFANGPKIAGAELYEMPMLEEHDYLIQFDQIPEEVAHKAKMMIVSYPNNPTGATAPDWFYEELICFAKKYDIMVLHDTAYSELVFDGQPGRSFLYYEGAKDIGIEFNSFSKTYGMAGARIGICAGNADIVEQLRILKSNIDYGMFLPIQKAAIAALTQDQQVVTDTRNQYQKRRDMLVAGLCQAGWNVTAPKATMFMWARIPEQYNDCETFSLALLQETGVLVTPGTSFGSLGSQYVRIALVQSEEVIAEAIKVLQESHFFHG